MSSIAKRELFLQGLKCANCASKIEAEIKNLDGLKSASVDFVSKKMTLEVEDKKDLNTIIQQATKIAERIEDGLKVVDGDDDAAADPNKHGLDKMEMLKLGICVALFFAAFLFNLHLGLALAYIL